MKDPCAQATEQYACERIILYVSREAGHDLQARLKTMSEDTSIRRLVEATLEALRTDLPAEVRSRREDL